VAISEAIGIVKNLRSGDYVRNADVEIERRKYTALAAISLQILCGPSAYLCGLCAEIAL
jgi:hypothetical protein